MFYTGIGSRETPEEVLVVMEDLAVQLERRGYTLRSGGADGADSAFERGAITKKEIWLPWDRFNNHVTDNKQYFIPPKATERLAVEIARRIHPAWGRLSEGARRLHTRNVYQVLGCDLNRPSEFVIAWARVKNGRPTGGTATALKLATELNIPCFNLFEPNALDVFKSIYLVDHTPMKKELEEVITVDSYHWHEALHTAHVLNCMCQDHLVDHVTYNHVSEEARNKLTQAMVLINDYYQECAKQQDQHFSVNISNNSAET